MTEPTPPAAPAPGAVPAVSPVSTAGNKALAFSLFIIIANLLFNAISSAALGPDTTPGTAWAWVIANVVVDLVLAAVAITFGVRGLRETSGGKARGRGAAIAGIIVASVLLVFIVIVTLMQLGTAYAA